MISRFNITGTVTQLNFPDVVIGTGIKNCVMLVKVDADEYPITLQGNILALAEDGKIKPNDIVYVEGKLCKDRQLQLNQRDTGTKMIAFLLGTYLNVVVAAIPLASDK